MGGVLAVTDVRADAKSGIKAGIVGNKRVYITAQTLPSAPVSLDYTVANAQGIATGTIVVQPPALTSADSVPKASDITVPVRTGGIVSVDVLDHVSYTGASASRWTETSRLIRASSAGSPSPRRTPYGTKLPVRR